MQDVGDIAKNKLSIFMKEEWNKFNEQYFESTEPYLTLDKYAKKFISTNLEEKRLYQEKFQSLLKTISWGDVYAKRNYDLQVYRKNLYEFPIKNPMNIKEVDKFMESQLIQQRKIRQLEIYLKNPAQKTL